MTVMAAPAGQVAMGPRPGLQAVLEVPVALACSALVVTAETAATVARVRLAGPVALAAQVHLGGPVAQVDMAATAVRLSLTVVLAAAAAMAAVVWQ